VRVLIVGNMGYVGPVVVGHLRQVMPQSTLIGYDLGLFAHCLTDTRGLPERLLDAQLFGDVRSIEPRHLEGIDAVVDLAAISNDPMGNQFAELTDAVNHKAAVRLAGMARDQGVRSFVFASSCSVYGFAEGAPRRETDALEPLTPYARSKIDTENALRGMNSGDMTVSCLRFATACGFSPRLRLDLVLNDFVAGALASGEIGILSDGTPWRPLIDVADMARAIEWAIGRTPESGGKFLSVNVGSDDWNVQVRDLAASVADRLPGTRVSINSSAAPDRRSYRVDFSRYRGLAPQHQPRVSLPQSVEALAAGLRRIGFADKDFRNGPAIRLRTLNRLMAEGVLSSDLGWRHADVAQGTVS
jgi:nucleoside-diphosphate-sugar epimerase